MANKTRPAQTKYITAVGRRKTAIAQVKFFPEGTGKFIVNSKEFTGYFPTIDLQKQGSTPLSVTGLNKLVDVEVKVKGGGKHGQAQAVSLGLARAIVKLEAGHKLALKKQKLLTRDARKKERKKPGLKRARRAPQWQKR